MMRMNKWVAGLLAMAAMSMSTLSVSTLAWADEAPDEVTLKNGGMVRGTVISVEPGDNVVIDVPGAAEPRVISWDEVDEVQRGKYADKPDARAKAPEPSSDRDAERPVSPSTVRFKIASDNPDVQLYRTSGGGVIASADFVAVAQYHEPVCTNPCNREIDATEGGTYFFGGPGVTASDAFTLSGYRGDTTAEVDAGSSAANTAGWWMAYTGAAALLTGITFTVMGFAIDDPSGTFESFQIVGPVVGGVGAAFLGTGIALIATSGTEYEISQDAKVRVGPGHGSLSYRF